MRKRNSRGFTMIETMTCLVLVAGALIMAFESLGTVGVLRHKIESQIDMNRDIYDTVETLVAMIKEGGEIDYEEYWNRKAAGYGETAGHYSALTGLGNYWSGGSVGSSSYGDWYYYCASTPSVPMGTGGCLVPNRPQRFGQYAYQFVDYNSNGDDDTAKCVARGFGGMSLGDENCDGNIRYDDDDEVLGKGPAVFTGGTALKELYLLKKSPRYERVYFRRVVRQDPSVAGNPNFPCDIATGSGVGCIGNVQILRMSGYDLGKTHLATGSSVGLYDGLVDTWKCYANFPCADSAGLATGLDSEWVDLFPDTINVTDLKFTIFPNKDYTYAWRENTQDTKVHEYIQLSVTIGYSWKTRRYIKVANPNVTVVTTVNLQY